MATLATNPIAHQPQQRAPRLPAPVGLVRGLGLTVEDYCRNPHYIGPDALIEIHKLRYALDAIGQGLASDHLTVREQIDQVIIGLLNLESVKATEGNRIGNVAWYSLLDIRRALYDFEAFDQACQERMRASLCTRLALKMAVILHTYYKECGQ
jgi:hypothetical protein